MKRLLSCSVALLLGGFAAPVHAAPTCEYTVDGDHVCIHRVQGPRSKPWLNTAYISINNGPVRQVLINCKNSTFIFSGGTLQGFGPRSTPGIICRTYDFDPGI